SLTVGQYIPKSIALTNPDKTMMSLTGIIFYTKIITFPVVYIYANISKAIANLFKIKTETDSLRRSDIIHAMSEYEEESSRLAARLFNFSKRVVSEVMIPLNTCLYRTIFMARKPSGFNSVQRLASDFSFCWFDKRIKYVKRKQTTYCY
ncbi:unnamed protein product, partial [marine sediment metagenome]